MRNRLVVLILFLAFVLTPAHARAWEPPKLTGAVVDTSGRLTDAERAALEQRLGDYRRRTTNEVVVFLVGSLAGETVEDVAYRSFNTWGIGKKGKDNGVLLVIAPAEHRMRIETGKGVGDKLTDIESSHILRERVGPALKENHYAAASNAGVDAIISALDGPPPAPASAIASASASAKTDLGWLQTPAAGPTLSATARPRARPDDGAPAPRAQGPAPSWYDGISWFFVLLVLGLVAGVAVFIRWTLRKNQPFKHSGLPEWTPGGPNIEPSTTATPYEPPTAASLGAPVAPPDYSTSTSSGGTSDASYTGGGGTSGGGGSSDSW